jgi:hypothetical protein
VGVLDAQARRDAAPVNCERCQSDLAAFIDLEAEDPVQAATLYPHVWWHLWTCEACAETYEFTHTLLDAQRAAEIAPLRFARRVDPDRLPLIRQVRLNRGVLALALPARTSPAAVLRGSDDRYVLFDQTEDEPERHKFTIVAEELKDGAWRVFVTVIPPPPGLLVLTFGSQRFVAPFAPDGTAVVDAIPAEMLLRTDGPDMDIRIVTPDGI